MGSIIILGGKIYCAGNVDPHDIRIERYEGGILNNERLHISCGTTNIDIYPEKNFDEYGARLLVSSTKESVNEYIPPRTREGHRVVGLRIKVD